MKSYWEQTYDYLKKNGKITNKEVIEITNTNCPHSVIRDLKKHGILLTEKTEHKNGKKYKIYFYAGKMPKVIESVKTDFETVGQIGLNLGIIAKVEETELERQQRMIKMFGYC